MPIVTGNPSSKDGARSGSLSASPQMPIGGNQLAVRSTLDQATVRGMVSKGPSCTDRIVGLTNATAGQTTVWTNCIKREAEAPFSAVRIKIYGRDTAASTGFSFVVAPTSTGEVANANQMFRPTKDGVTFTTSLASSSNPGGWRVGTWAGAATTTVAAGAALLPGESPWSDWIACESIKRTDGKTLPLLMLRIFKDGTVNPFSGPSGIFSTTQWNSPDTKNKDYWRLYQSGIFAGDAVSTLTNEPGSLAGSGFWVAIQFATNVPAARTLLGIGDSILEANATQLPGNALGAYGMRACARASTPQRPITWVNSGASGQNSTVFLTAGLVAIKNLAPSDVLYAAGSPNDTPPDEFISANSFANVLKIRNACNDVDATLLLATTVPHEGYTIAQDKQRLLYNDKIRKYCAEGNAVLVDLDSVLNSGRTPSTYRPGFAFDAIHPSDAGMDAESYVLADALLSSW